MSIETIYKCDHCGTRCSGDEYASIGRWDEPGILVFGKTVHGCSKEHLGFALAKAFGIGVDGNANELLNRKQREITKLTAELEARIAELERQDRDAFTPNPISMMVDSWANPKKEWDAANGKTPGTLARDVFCQGVPDLDSRVIGGAAAKSWELAAQAVLRAFGQPSQTTQDVADALRRVRKSFAGYQGECAAVVREAIGAELAKLEAKPTTNAEAVAMYEATKDAARRAFPDEPQAITLPTKPTKPLRERLEELATYWYRDDKDDKELNGAYRLARQECAKELREVINDPR